MAKFKVGDRVVEDKAVSRVDLVRHWNTYWKHQEGSLIGEEFIITRASDYGVSYSNRLNGRGPTIENKYLKLAPLKIEAGKFYKTRDGRKAGPAKRRQFTPGTESNYVWIVKLVGFEDEGHFVYTDEGRYCSFVDHSFDLVAEWIDEPATANDNTAPAKPKFKVGDKIRHKALGHVGHIKELVAGGCARVFWDNVGWGATDPLGDIELIIQPTAIVCLIENGQPKPSVNPFVHGNAEAAATEAKRLAGKHLGKTFGVYVLQSTAAEAAPTYRHEWQRLAAKGEKIAAIKELRGITGLGLKATKDAVEHWLANDEPASRAAA